MKGKKFRMILGIVWGVLALPAGYVASIIYGLSRLDSGIPILNPQTIALFLLPVVLVVSCIGLLLSIKKMETKPKNNLASIFAVLPLINVLLIVLLVWWAQAS